METAMKCGTPIKRSSSSRAKSFRVVSESPRRISVMESKGIKGIDVNEEVLNNILLQMSRYKESLHKEQKSETMVFYGNFDPTEPVLSVSLASIYPLLIKNSDLRNLCFNCLGLESRCHRVDVSLDFDLDQPLMIHSLYLRSTSPF